MPAVGFLYNAGMNYLAHLYLAGPGPEARIGNLMGDFVKGPIPEDLPLVRQRGIALHRRIDSFTDRHPLVLRSKRRLNPPFRRYAGIIVDLFYDHLLAAQWHEYHEQPLSEFADEINRLLERDIHTLPERMQRSMRYLLQHNLLYAYREPAGIARALQGLQSRLSRPNPLGMAIDELRRHHDGLNADFTQFFPELIDFSECQKRILNHH